MKIAIIGTGITGLSAAWLLHQKHQITVFEKNNYCGGHSNTIEEKGHNPVDTGFIVYNDWTYPNLIALFEHLDVDVQPTDMSFAVSMDNGAFEYSGENLFSQKRNLLRFSHYRMIMDLLRFYREAPKLLQKDSTVSMAEYLHQNRYSKAFIEKHLYPMAAAIWSMPANDVAAFPAQAFIRFFENHGLLILKDRPQWRTVTGGSRSYVEKLTASFKDHIRLNTPAETVVRYQDHVTVNNEPFDHVILACHADQSLAILKDASKHEQDVLSAFPYKENIAYLHQDKNMMPKDRKIWSSWNYMTEKDMPEDIYVSYWMNNLQGFLPPDDPLFVTLNPAKPPEEEKVIKRIKYHHPQYGENALKGWERIKTIQGKHRTWFCGAWCGYGFHEDGLSAGLAVAEALGGLKRPWDVADKSPAGTHATPEDM